MLKVEAIEIFRHEMRTRLPFRYGIVTMTDLPHLFIRARVTLDGERSTGLAADHLPPKWFTKEAAVPLDREIDDMLAVITHAAEAALALQAETPFAWWHQLWTRQAAWAAEHGHPALLAHFGTSLIERAVIDAVCRARRLPWHQLLRTADLGVDWIGLAPEFPASGWVDLLPAVPPASATLRHTVGLADAIRADEVQDRPADDLPVSLEESIRAYGLREFKLKLSGDALADRRRLRAIAEVILTHVPGSFRFSLDGNEQYASPAAFRAFADELLSDALLKDFFTHLSFIEQPISRKVALAPGQTDIRQAWPEAVPFIIDESDGDWDDLPRAIALGYAGVSHKNCKGLFKGLRNALLIAQHRRDQPGDRSWLTSGEDLCTVGPVSLLQDLAVQASFGNSSIERNGHHYFAGLAAFPPDLAAAIAARHPDVYAADPQLGARLRVESGSISLSTLNQTALGCTLDPECTLPGKLIH